MILIVLFINLYLLCYLIYIDFLIFFSVLFCISYWSFYIIVDGYVFNLDFILLVCDIKLNILEIMVILEECLRYVLKLNLVYYEFIFCFKSKFYCFIFGF